jgi:hypothetical protein
VEAIHTTPASQWRGFVVANSQLEWLKAASSDIKAYRAMVVGSQTVLATMTETVLRFNHHHFAHADDAHHEMKVVAAKQIVIASLRELRLMIDRWNNKLRDLGALSQATVDLRRKHRQILDRIDKFRDVRNCAFHFGDPLEVADDLIALYEYVQGFDLDDLNEMLRALYDVVVQMRQDAILAAERLENQQSGS